MSVLRRAKKVRTDGSDWQMIRMNPSHEEILQKPELIPKTEAPPKKRRKPADRKAARTSRKLGILHQVLVDAEITRPMGTRSQWI